MKKIILGLVALSSISGSAFANDYKCKLDAVKQDLHRGYTGKISIHSSDSVGVETYRTVCALATDDSGKKIFCRNVFEAENFILEVGGTYTGEESGNVLVIDKNKRGFDAIIYSDITQGKLAADFRKCR
ncbi:MAG: hypothetical protein ACOYL6_15875 [Bacteriovoracaceae bacterium]